MSDHTTISASERERVGKGSARAARRAGLVPAVIYGNKKDPVGITMEAREITKIVHQPGIFGRLLDIDVAGTKSTVLTRDIQFHPVNDAIMHMDFLRVSQSATVAVAVAVEFINEDKCPRIKAGGVRNVGRHDRAPRSPAAATLHPQLAGGKIDLVIEDEDVVIRNLVESCRFGNRQSGTVHEGLRLDREDFFPAEPAFGELRAILVFPA